MKPSRSHCLMSILALVLIAPLACEEKSNAPTGTTSTSSLPAGFFVSQEPAGKIGVLGVRQGAKAGDRVAMLGRIGGSEKPFVSNRAVFTLVDPSLKSCSEMDEEDHCPTPFDYCCVAPEQLSKGMASVSINDPTGKPLAMSLPTEGSLKPLMLIVVEGVVQPTENGAFIVNANHIYKMPNDPLAGKVK